MNSPRSEYLPNGNGHANGNGKSDEKVFYLQRATDPDTLAVLEARETALADDRLTRSMKAFFCKVVDMSLHPRYFECKGVVTVSDTYLATFFRVSTRSVYTWKKSVEARGYFWVTYKGRPNMWAITTYHLTCLHKPREDRRTDNDGTYGSDGVRAYPSAPGQGARRPGQPGLPLPGSRQTAPDGKNADSLGISGENGKALRARAEADCGPEPKSVAGQSRSGLLTIRDSEGAN